MGEAAHDLPRDLEVRELVLTDRDDLAVDDGDVRGLQDRVRQVPGRVDLARRQLAELLLVGRVALQPSERRDHRQVQEELGNRGDLALAVDDGTFGVEAGGDEVGDELAHVRRQ